MASNKRHAYLAVYLGDDTDAARAQLWDLLRSDQCFPITYDAHPRWLAFARHFRNGDHHVSFTIPRWESFGFEEGVTLVTGEADVGLGIGIPAEMHARIAALDTRHSGQLAAVAPGLAPAGGDSPLRAALELTDALLSSVVPIVRGSAAGMAILLEDQLETNRALLRGDPAPAQSPGATDDPTHTDTSHVAAIWADSVEQIARAVREMACQAYHEARSARYAEGAVVARCVAHVVAALTYWFTETSDSEPWRRALAAAALPPGPAAGRSDEQTG